MLNRITSYLLKSACIAAFVFAMSSQADAFWYNGYWYNYPTYRPAYYTAYGPVYYSAYRPVYTTYYTPASACSSCNVGCAPCSVGRTTCRVGCAPCGCSPCQCSPCSDTGSVSSTSAEPIPETVHMARSRGDAPTAAPVPLDLDEGIVSLRVAPTRQRVRVEAHDRVSHVARLNIEPAPASAWRPIPDSQTYVVSK